MHVSSRSAGQRLVVFLVSLAAAAHPVNAAPGTREDDATLVVYSYRHADPEALDNLQYFVGTVIKPQDTARYIIVVDHAMQQHGHMSSHGLPALSVNAEYLTIRDCFELGHVGKVLLGEKSSVHVSMDHYSYFVWLDSSAKGPLLPSHTVQGDRAPAWHTLLTSRITATTKLVGASITCEPVREDFIPHVEATIMATDAVGLQVLQKAKCFDCYATWHEAKMKGEVAASAAILKAGYNLDCFNPPHQGVNWRDKSAWPCAKTVRQHPQEAANGAMKSHVEKFRSQGGGAFGALQEEEYDASLEAAQTQQHDMNHEQRVSDSLMEAGFVKPLQHENPDSDKEQTSRIGDRLVESGFGRLQFEDAMEHVQRAQPEGVSDTDSDKEIEGFSSVDELAEPAKGSHASEEDDRTAELAHAVRTHAAEFKDELLPEGTHVTEAGDAADPVHAGRSGLAEVQEDPMLLQSAADDTVDLINPGRTHVADVKGDEVSQLCPELELEPVPRSDLHLQNEAAQLAAEVAELDHAEGVDIAFYGDSITNLWKNAVPATGGRANVFWDHFGSYTSAILAVGGDQTANLWWRILHGETFEQQQPKLAVVLIGINDLGAAAACGASFITDAAEGVAQRIISIVSHLQQANPDTNVLLVGILPCAEVMSPGPEGLFLWPNSFSAGTANVNEALEEFASQHALVHYVDCADDMLVDGQISESVMPDGVHPNAAGMERLARCLSPSISTYAQHRKGL